MVRALVLVPLLAVGLDQARVSLVCEPGAAQSCLEAAGSGRFGRRDAPARRLRALGGRPGWPARRDKVAAALWMVAVAGLWAACGGQALLADVLGSGPALLGGGWLPLLAFAGATGALLSLALRGARKLARPPRLRAAARSAPASSGFTPRRAAPPRATPPRRLAPRPAPRLTAAVARRARNRPRVSAPCPHRCARPLLSPNLNTRPTERAPHIDQARDKREQRRAPREAAERAERDRQPPAVAGSGGSAERPGSPRSSWPSSRPCPASGGAAKTLTKSTVVAGVQERNGVLGDPKAPVTITEYVDLQCPVCAEASQAELPTLINDYVKTGKVKLQMRTMELPRRGLITRCEGRRRRARSRASCGRSSRPSTPTRARRTPATSPRTS